MGYDFFKISLYIWIGLAIVIFPILLYVTVPYGRHRSKKWGYMISNRLGWILMEIPVLVVFTYFFFSGSIKLTLPLYIFYGLFILHYINRIFIFPFQLRGKNKKMPLLIAILAIFFNLCNGFFNGYWFGHLSPGYSNEWLMDWRFIIGLIVFISGMAINILSDQKLILLRKGGKSGYYIPYGGLFKYISSPNLFGEILEWLGWALMSWCLPAFSFAIWTFANLFPRALDHHKWYKKEFPDYPKERKAIIPHII